MRVLEVRGVAGSREFFVSGRYTAIHREKGVVASALLRGYGAHGLWHRPPASSCARYAS